jgi:lipoprotein-anchoring transpeptidase ErfK/SrfK
MKNIPALILLPLLSIAGPASAQFSGSLEGLDRIKVPAVAAAGEQKETLEQLRKEAAADPDRFIDERTPEEVGLVFDLFSGEKYGISSEAASNATVRILVNLTMQRLTVTSPEVNATYEISSGVKGHGTPGSGRCFAPDFLDANHRSSLYGGAPMPNSVFFNGNIAIHATFDTAHLGRPASHGCVRVSKENSKAIFDLVKTNGKKNTSICVTGRAPGM